MEMCQHNAKVLWVVFYGVLNLKPFGNAVAGVFWRVARWFWNPNPKSLR